MGHTSTATNNILLSFSSLSMPTKQLSWQTLAHLPLCDGQNPLIWTYFGQNQRYFTCFVSLYVLLALIGYVVIVVYKSTGSMVWGYDSRFGCERSWVQIPVEPTHFRLKGTLADFKILPHTNLLSMCIYCCSIILSKDSVVHW